MADLSVVAVVVAKPGQEDTVQEALRTLASTSLSEDGCLGYEVFASQSAPSTFVTKEQWRDGAALDTHLRGPNLAKAFATARDALAAPPDVHPLTPLD